MIETAFKYKDKGFDGYDGLKSFYRDTLGIESSSSSDDEEDDNDDDGNGIGSDLDFEPKRKRRKFNEVKQRMCNYACT